MLLIKYNDHAHGRRVLPSGAAFCYIFLLEKTMSVIIATWEKIGENVFDAGFVLNEKYEPMMFDNFDEASDYVDNNDDKIGTYYRLIDEI